MNRSEVVRDALRHKHRKETLERAIGKAIRRIGGSYEDYIEVMSYIRERREAEKLDLMEAARKIADED